MKNRRWTYSIRHAMVIAFSLITLAVLATAFTVAFRFTVDEVRSVSVDYVSQLVAQVNGEIDRYMVYMEDVGEVVGKNTAVLRWLDEGENMGRSQLLVLEDTVQMQLSGIVNIRKDITNIAVFAEPNRAVFDNRGKKLNPYSDYKKLDWYTEAISGERPTFITSTQVQNVIAGRYDWVVTMSKPIIAGRDIKGILIVDLNYSVINNLCQSVDMGQRGYLYVADREGDIIYHPQQQLIYSHIKSENVREVLGKDTIAAIHTDEGKKLYISNHSPRTGWTVVGVAYQDELLQNSTDIIWFYSMVFGVFFIVAILLSAVIGMGITKPLKRLVDGMKDVEMTGRLDTRIDTGGPREVLQLSQAFNTMLERLRQLMSQREKDQEQRRKSELKALQAQINPHFLYNTLDSIIWMAENDETEQVVEMTAALAHLFRSSISESREMVPLHIEIAHIRSYLTIQKMRYKEKLGFSVEIPVSIGHYIIPKLVLQPLIENAIYHGIKPRATGGVVKVSGHLEGENLILDIHDNGVGIPQELLQTGIFNAKPRKQGSGIGVKNVHERIILTFGSQYGLTFESGPKAGGTLVRVTLPAIEEGGR